MNESTTGALIVFGILLVIALIGLFRSSSAAERLHGSGDDRNNSTSPRNTTRFSDTAR